MCVCSASGSKIGCQVPGHFQGVLETLVPMGVLTVTTGRVGGVAVMDYCGYGGEQISESSSTILRSSAIGGFYNETI